MNKLESTKILRYAKKIKSINYLGGECVKCGESNLFKLTFHHRDPGEKEFSYSDYKGGRWSKLKEELDKCDVLCQNCHCFEHSDSKFFEEYKDLIYERLNIHEEVQPKIDRSVVKKMYNDGIRQADIARHFNASKSTICLIIKKIKLGD